MYRKKYHRFLNCIRLNFKRNYAICLLLLFSIAFSKTLISGVFFRNYIATHWLLTYDYGFIKRGLIGTLNNFIFGSSYASKQIILITSCIIFILLTLFLFIIVHKLYYKSQNFKILFPAFLFVSSPISISFFSTEIGRYDQICYLITLTILFYILEFHSFVKYIFIGILCIISILIHEAFLFIQFPIIIAMSIFKLYIDKMLSKSNLKLLCTYIIIPTFIMLVIIILYGKQSNIEYNQFIYHLHTKANFNVSEGPVKTVYFTIQDNLDFTIPRLVCNNWSKCFLFSFLSTIFSAIPSLIMLFYLWYKLLMHSHYNKFLLYLIILCCVSPLMLSIVAVDFGRWTAFAIFNLYLSMFSLSLICNQYSHFDLPNIFAFIVFVGVIFSFFVDIFFGPLAENSGLPFLYHIIS